MCASILKRTCNALLITIMLTSSLIKQGFAMEARVGGVQRQNPVASKANLSPAVQNLKTKLTRRTNAYNAQSEQPSIPRDTSEINRIYQSAPSDRHANDDEREALIKGLMFTAGIHGTAMPLNLQQSSKGSTLNALQKHYAIIHALDVLSRDYFVNDIFSSQEDQYVLLQNYAGLGKGTINEWLGYTRGELTGLTKPNGKYWRNQGRCDAALSGKSIPAESGEIESNKKRPDSPSGVMDLERLPISLHQSRSAYQPVTREEAMRVLKNQELVISLFQDLKYNVQTDRNEIAHFALQLIGPSANSSDISNIVRSLRDFVGDRAEFVKFVRDLFENIPHLSCGSCIHHLAKVTGDRPEFVKLVKKLTGPSTNSSDILHIVCSLRDFVGDRAEFVDLVRDLFENMPHLPCGLCIDAVVKITRDRSEFVSLLKKLIRPNMSDHAILDIIRKFRQCRNHAEIVGLLHLLIRPDTPENYIVDMIIPLDMAAERSPEILMLARQLISPDMNFGTFNFLIQQLCRIPAEWSNRMARALLFMRNGNHNVWGQVLESPLDRDVMLGGMNAVARGANPHAAGINVHDGLRDQRTIAAVKRLREGWSPKQDEIHSEFNDFWKAVRALPTRIDQLPEDIQESYHQAKNDLSTITKSDQKAESKALQDKIDVVDSRLTLQERLLRTLGVTLDGGEAIPRSSADFGGLLTGTEGRITLMHGNSELRINAKELIARFWHFANTYLPDDVPNSNSSSTSYAGSDRGNIRAAIMNGLADGLQMDSPTSGHVVCDPGKIQRLVMGTINGRLRLANGLLVDIDDAGLVNGSKKAAEEPLPAATAAPQAPQAVPMITNLNEIGQYLKPFIDDLGYQPPQNGNEFFMRLFQYRNALADGRINHFKGERIDLDPSQVVYYVRMMSPAIKEGGVIRVPAEINPSESLVA